jgi:hypothetical protein
MGKCLEYMGNRESGKTRQGAALSLVDRADSHRLPHEGDSGQNRRRDAYVWR